MRGDKTKYVQEAILALGKTDPAKVTLQEANTWIKKQYGVSYLATDSVFYNMRKRLSQGVEFPETRPPIKDLVAAGTTVQPENGIAALVRQLKQIVDKVGKDEAKQLIDVF